MSKYSNSHEQNVYAANNKLEEPKGFFMDLTEEYEDKVKSLDTRISETTANHLRLKDEITLRQQERKDSSQLFSPNTRHSDMEGLKRSLGECELQLNKLTAEREKYHNAIRDLKEAARLLQLEKDMKRRRGYEILKFQEQDRQRIARDLHDSTVQNLTGLIHKLELCARMVDIDPVRAKLELAAMTIAVKSSINEIRDIIYNLKPMMLDDLGLSTTVERYAKQLMANHNIKVFVKYSKLEESLPGVIRVSIFRVIQEACNNVIKHAKATRIDINMTNKDDNLIVVVKDNGIGFDIDKQRDIQTENRSGYGISIMKERINILSGTMSISLNELGGTIISFTVPLIRYGEDKNEQTY